MFVRGRYEPLEVRGRGGEGEVVLAWDHQHDRAVALKVREAADDADRARLLSEARVLLALRPHPSLPVARDDFFEDGRHYLVLDFVAGQNLEVRLRTLGAPGLAYGEVVRWLHDVADALDHLHGHEPAVVHGDVKPANVVLHGGGADTRAVLVDFGTAGARRAVAGTPAYVAPEVAAGDAVTPASDVYSLAATAFALLTGDDPSPGADLGLPTVPAPHRRAVRSALRRGLAVDPAARPTSCRELVALLGEPGAAPVEVDVALTPTAPLARRARVPRRVRRLAAAVAALLVAGSAGLVARTGDDAATPARAPVAVRAGSLRSTPATTTSPTTAAAAGGEPAPPSAPSPTFEDAAPVPTLVRGGPLAVTTSPAERPVLGPRFVSLHRDGAAEITEVAPDRTLHPVARTDGAARDVELVASIGFGLVFVYRPADGRNRILRAERSGALVPVGSIGGVNPGWTHIVGLGEGHLLFYRTLDGAAAGFRIDDEARLYDSEGYDQRFAAGFDVVAAVGGRRAFLYDTALGNITTVHFATDGTMLDKTNALIDAGYDLAAHVGGQHVALHDTADGSVDVIRLGAPGRPPLTGSASVAAGRIDAVGVPGGALLWDDDGVVVTLPVDEAGRPGASGAARIGSRPFAAVALSS